MISLSDPKKYIIDRGGYICYAKLHGEIVGTASLLKKSDTIYELGKMAVAKQKQILTLVLYSNTILQSAIHLYKKYGFEEIELESGLYERANIKMVKHLLVTDKMPEQLTVGLRNWRFSG